MLQQSPPSKLHSALLFSSSQNISPVHSGCPPAEEQVAGAAVVGEGVGAAVDGVGAAVVWDGAGAAVEEGLGATEVVPPDPPQALGAAKIRFIFNIKYCFGEMNKMFYVSRGKSLLESWGTTFLPE